MGGQVDPGPPQLVAGWLPADLTTDEPLAAVPASGIELTGQVLYTPGRESEMLVVEAVARDGERYSDQVWTELMSRIGATWGDDGHQEGSASGTGANFVLGRGAATEQEVHAVFSALVASRGVPIDMVMLPDGWPPNLTLDAVRPLNWLPGIAASDGRTHTGADPTRGRRRYPRRRPA